MQDAHALAQEAALEAEAAQADAEAAQAEAEGYTMRKEEVLAGAPYQWWAPWVFEETGIEEEGQPVAAGPPAAAVSEEKRRAEAEVLEALSLPPNQKYIHARHYYLKP